MTIPSDPCLRRVQADLESAEFAAGVAAGMWRVISLGWPFLIVAITAGDDNELVMRLQLDGYPSSAPAGQPWDLDLDDVLASPRWPQGGTASQIFRLDWSVSNLNAPYVACDRIPLGSHPDWANDPRAWHANRTVAFYLQEIHFELSGATIPCSTKEAS